MFFFLKKLCSKKIRDQSLVALTYFTSGHHLNMNKGCIFYISFFFCPAVARKCIPLVQLSS